MRLSSSDIIVDSIIKYIKELLRLNKIKNYRYLGEINGYLEIVISTNNNSLVFKLSDTNNMNDVYSNIYTLTFSSDIINNSKIICWVLFKPYEKYEDHFLTRDEYNKNPDDSMNCFLKNAIHHIDLYTQNCDTIYQQYSMNN